MAKKVRPRLRDRASWPPMAAGASSRNLGEAFLAVSVQLSHKKKEREKELERRHTKAYSVV